MIEVRLVLAWLTTGMIEASATHRFSHAVDTELLVYNRGWVAGRGPFCRCPRRGGSSRTCPGLLEVLAFIRRFMDHGGLPPTRGEIAEGLRLKNRQGIDQHLRALAAKGAIELIPGISRGIRLAETTPPGLPLLGRIAAGAPILAAANIEDYVNVDPALFRPAADFLLRVRGDSMKDADILDRDLLAVHRTHRRATARSSWRASATKRR